MTRESRLVAVLLTMSAIGVSGLSFVASQYRKALVANPGAHGARRVDPAQRASTLVAGFVAARAAIKAVVSGYAGTPEQLREDGVTVRSYRAARESALAAYGMTPRDYAEARAAWRAVRAGRPVEDPALAGLLAAGGSAFDEASLGALEALDDAID